MDEINQGASFRSGFISLIGRPNVGKSTLLNALVGQKIAAVSPKPSTTRNRILGVRNADEAQMVFLDTPGISKPRGALSKIMVQTALDTLREVDVVLLLIEADAPFVPGDRYIMGLLPSRSVLVINKIDKVKKPRLLEIMSRTNEEGDGFLEVVPVSAVEGDGMDDLAGAIIRYLPEGPKYFPEDAFTDQPERFIVAEFIREKIFRFTRDEIPYRAGVVVVEFNEVPEKNLIRIAAEIFVEKEGHKGILIGRKGEMLKRIGSAAREDVERLLNSRVYLEIRVKVKERWTEKPRDIDEFGYGV